MKILQDIKILNRHGKQYIPDITLPKLPDTFRGRPEISTAQVDEQAVAALCPTEAILTAPMRIDLGKCVFCGECAFAYPEKIKFTSDYKIATNDRSKLIVAEGVTDAISLNPDLVRAEIQTRFSHSLRLRQVSAGGDNSQEGELNATMNVNFDIARFGIEFVASPRAADAIVITGPISENMAEALQVCYEAIAEPKLIILVGTEAISGGIFAGSPALNRSFLDKYPPDLYVPGSPIHPLTFINGILALTRRGEIK
jgi:Ni,Fe-hydrogenase III small subunit